MDPDVFIQMVCACLKRSHDALEGRGLDVVQNRLQKAGAELEVRLDREATPRRLGSNYSQRAAARPEARVRRADVDSRRAQQYGLGLELNVQEAQGEFLLDVAGITRALDDPG
jgi:hypothetical protein